MDVSIDRLEVRGAVLGGAWASGVDAQVMNVRCFGEEPNHRCLVRDGLELVREALRQKSDNRPRNYKSLICRDD